ncbi:MarR family winged helix-turn-helix transcriptional regulator [Emcibacter nanhaiensis]|uniref:MarR family transcriptional regulator n=1 Tax=Emcibacter nanhaiensis TaxID=1505037 RepID=A0A501PGN8_9PROT|nr:MarR family transcriptional regulator [Emcibacter nanhaiensis]TPD59151.1 MarR family transcriptional regulator [Emcibacter nanhaiensis]
MPDLPPADDLLKLENQTCFRLYAASRAITKIYQPLLAEIDLTYPQYLAMLVLWENCEAVTVRTLGQRLMLDSGTLSPLLKRLAAKGLLLKTRGKQDEREVYVSLTEKGTALKEKARQIPELLLCRVLEAQLPVQQVNERLDQLLEFLTGSDQAATV